MRDLCEPSFDASDKNRVLNPSSSEEKIEAMGKVWEDYETYKNAQTIPEHFGYLTGKNKNSDAVKIIHKYYNPAFEIDRESMITHPNFSNDKQDPIVTIHENYKSTQKAKEAGEAAKNLGESVSKKGGGMLKKFQDREIYKSAKTISDCFSEKKGDEAITVLGKYYTPVFEGESTNAVAHPSFTDAKCNKVASIYNKGKEVEKADGPIPTYKTIKKEDPAAAKEFLGKYFRKVKGKQGKTVSVPKESSKELVFVPPEMKPMKAEDAEKRKEQMRLVQSNIQKITGSDFNPSQLDKFFLEGSKILPAYHQLNSGNSDLLLLSDGTEVKKEVISANEKECTKIDKEFLFVPPDMRPVKRTTVKENQEKMLELEKGINAFTGRDFESSDLDNFFLENKKITPVWYKFD